MHNLPTIEHEVAQLSKIHVDDNDRLTLPDGRVVESSDKFWSSWSSMFKIDTNIFKTFSHKEVFGRVDGRVRVIMVDNLAVGCADPSKTIVEPGHIDSLMDLGPIYSIYGGGIYNMVFPVRFDTKLYVGSDALKPRFSVDIYIDSGRLPTIHLAAAKFDDTIIVARNRDFKANINLGKSQDKALDILKRNIVSFNDESGYKELAEKLTTGFASWASYYESSSLYKILGSALADLSHSDRSKYLNMLTELCGDPLEWYGISTGSDISDKKSKKIPVKSNVYDLINFAGYVSTKIIASRSGKMEIENWIGKVLMDEFDLENSVKAFPRYEDFFDEK